MDYRIIRGANKIGGSITEIYSGEHKVWVDFGMELSVKDHQSDDFVIKKMKDDPPEAVLFTHIHGDHIGLLYAIPDGVKVYIGPVALKLMVNIRNGLLRMRDIEQKEKQKLQKERDILLDTNRTFSYKDGEPFCVATMTVTPFVVDHSVADAYMLRFEKDGKSILHTGDYRNHGRLGVDLYNKLENQIAPKSKPIDILITEGTMMSRTSEELFGEEEMQKEAEQLFDKHKYAFLLCSSTNMESLASFYQGMRASGRKRGKNPPFMVGNYVKTQLDVFSNSFGKIDKRFDFEKSYRIEQSLEKVLINNKTQREHMLDEGFLMLVSAKGSGELMEKFREYDPILIYSLWNGYLDKTKDYAVKEYINLVKSWKGRVKFLHTSGHAYPSVICKVIDIVNPREAIVPIHTEKVGGFFNLAIREEQKKMIRIHTSLFTAEELEACKAINVFTINDKDEITNINLDKMDEFAKEDNRAFDLDSDMITALKEGCMSAFVQLVKNHPELELCFRGNSGNKCVIYYRNHEFLSLSLVYNQCRIEFNDSHARYWKSKDDYKTDPDILLLESFGIKYVEKEKEADNLFSNQEVTGSDTRNTPHIWTIKEAEDIYGVRIKMLESYFDPEKRKDFFKNEVLESKVDFKLEKQEQQKLMAANSELFTGYYIYDMEYAQHYTNKLLKQAHQKLCGTKRENKPDSLAIRFEEGEPKALVFIELKSTKGAMEGSSGAAEHINLMNTYRNSRFNQAFIKHRRAEAESIMANYAYLGLHGFCDKNLTKEECNDLFKGKFVDLPVELLLVLATNAHDGNTVFDIKDMELERIDRAVAASKYVENPDNICEVIVLEKGEFLLADKYKLKGLPLVEAKAKAKAK